MQWNDKVLTRATLLKEVWQYKFVPETNLVDVHLGRLRRKVDAPNEAPMIRSIRGIGFVLSANLLSPAAPPSDQQPYGRRQGSVAETKARYVRSNDAERLAFA
jgi:DNA-binding winged helix-turn-helix (wHTH) protein